MVRRKQSIHWNAGKFWVIGASAVVLTLAIVPGTVFGLPATSPFPGFSSATGQAGTALRTPTSPALHGLRPSWPEGPSSGSLLAGAAAFLAVAGLLQAKRLASPAALGRLRARLVARAEGNPGLTVVQLKEHLLRKGETIAVNLIEQAESSYKAEAEVGTQEPAATPTPESDKEANALFAELKKLDASASTEDYFDEEANSWDLQGLKDDLEVAKSQGQGGDDKEAKLFAELHALLPDVHREDYFDEVDGWDVAGLETDLLLAKSAEAKKAADAAAAAADADKAKEMFAKLKSLEPESSEEAYFDEVEGLWDLKGLQHDLGLAQRLTVREKAVEAKAPRDGKPEPGSPEALFDELLQLKPDASEEDYYDEDEGWDMDGLREDLELERVEAAANQASGTSAPAAGTPAAGTPEAGTPEAMFAELAQLRPDASMDDYFEEDQGWDLDGLREDLDMERKEAGANKAAKAEVPQAATPAAAAPAAGTPEAMFAELAKLRPDASMDDYFEEDQGWDLDGLREDLELERKEAGAGASQAAAAAPPAPQAEAKAALKPATPAAGTPETMFAELVKLRPDASEEDYFDEDEGWDLDGLRDDLELERKEAGAGANEEDKYEALFQELKALVPSSEKEDYFDEDGWDVEGLESDLKLEREQAAAPKAAAPKATPKAAAKPAEAGTPEAMFAELVKLRPDASEEDYFDEDEGWDLDGLREDLELERKEAGAKEAPAGEAKEEDKYEALFEELRSLQPICVKEDYYDEDGWDAQGLESDLKIARQKAGKAAAPKAKAAPKAAAKPAAAEAGTPEAMFAELVKLRPDASEEDYFDEDEGWDLDGLREDLELERQEAGGKEDAASGADEEENKEAEAILAQLIKSDPRVSKSDYYDEESKEWDMEGLKDDLEVSKKEEEEKESEPEAEEEKESEPEAEESNPEAEAMLAELVKLDPRVEKSDYFDGSWDMEGLKSDYDLAIAQSAKEPEPAKPEPAPEPAKPSIEAGTAVLAKFEGEGAGWYKAVVHKVLENGMLDIAWDDDYANSQVHQDNVRILPPITVNAKVTAQWEGEGWYGAVVKEDRGDGKFLVSYDDYEGEEGKAVLPASQIRTHMNPPE